MRTVTCPTPTRSGAGRVVRRFLSPTPINARLGPRRRHRLQARDPPADRFVQGPRGLAAVAAAQLDDQACRWWAPRPAITVSVWLSPPTGSASRRPCRRRDGLTCQGPRPRAVFGAARAVRAQLRRGRARALELAGGGGRFCPPTTTPMSWRPGVARRGARQPGPEPGDRHPPVAEAASSRGCPWPWRRAACGSWGSSRTIERHDCGVPCRRHAGVLESTMADGLAGSIEEGSITVDLVRRHVDDMATVSEAEMADACGCSPSTTAWWWRHRGRSASPPSGPVASSPTRGHTVVVLTVATSRRTSWCGLGAEHALGRPRRHHHQLRVEGSGPAVLLVPGLGEPAALQFTLAPHSWQLVIRQ